MDLFPNINRYFEKIISKSENKAEKMNIQKIINQQLIKLLILKKD